MNLDFEKLAKSKSSYQSEWLKTIERVRERISVKDLSDQEFSQLFCACNIPKHFSDVTKLIYQMAKTYGIDEAPFQTLLLHVDDSHFDLSEWAEAISFFNDWLEEKNLTASFRMMLGYLSCCDESPDNQEVKHHFVQLLKDMLDLHGFKAAVKKQ